MPSVAVFIDYQNVYKRSREAFFYGKSIAHYEGQISPRKVGDEIVAKSNQHNPGHSLMFTVACLTVVVTLRATRPVRVRLRPGGLNNLFR